MTPRNPLTALGEIMQLAFVPADFDATLAFWTDTMGAGPFFAIDHVALEDLRYLGVPAQIDFSMVLGYWGGHADRADPAAQRRAFDLQGLA